MNGADVGGGVHICWSHPVEVRLMRARCQTCERRTYHVVASYEWYGPDGTCLRCGERYNEDGRAERPFARGWREQSKRDARASYRRRRSPTPANAPTETETPNG